MAQTLGRAVCGNERSGSSYLPTIAEIDGIRIMIFPFDHLPAHIHAFGADFRLKLAIADARVLEARGTVGPSVLRRLRGWVLRHRERLSHLWGEAARGNPIGRVED
jgi:hypothetical protein